MFCCRRHFPQPLVLPRLLSVRCFFSDRKPVGDVRRGPRGAEPGRFRSGSVRRAQGWGSTLGLWLAMSACATPIQREKILPPPLTPEAGLAELYRKALREPTSPTPHAQLARLFLDLQNPVLAIEEARTAVALAPADADAHAALALVLLRSLSGTPSERSAQLQDASSHMERALELEPNKKAWLTLGIEVMLGNGKPEEAQKLRVRLEAQKAQSAELARWDALIALSLHSYSQARLDFRTLTRLTSSPEGISGEALTSFLLGDEGEALTHFMRLTEQQLRARDRQVLVILALKREDFIDAVAQLRALFSRPEDEQALGADLELLDAVQRGQLKALALSDLFEARLALELADVERAEARLRRGLEVDRRLLQAPEMLGRLLLEARNDPRQALRVLNDAPLTTASYERFLLAVKAYKVLQDAPGAQEVLRDFIELVATDVDSGRRLEAREALEAMIGLLPVGSLWQFLVDLLVEENDAEGLGVAWDHLLTQVRKPETELILATGDGLVRLGRFAQAERLLRPALLRDPTDEGLLATLALLAKTQGHNQTAEEALRRLTVIHPQDASTWTGLGVFYLTSSRYEEGLVAFEEALRREQDLPEALAGLARALSGLKRRDDALATARRLTTVEPESAGSWLTLAQVAGAARLYDEQEMALRQAVQREPEDSDAWMHLGRFLLQAPDPRYRRYEDALAAARRAVALTDSIHPEPLDLQAEAHYELGQFQEALKTIDLAIVRCPESDYYHRQRRRIRNALESATSSTGGM